MVAVTILSFLFLLAVPTYKRIQRKAKTAAMANDFRTFATAIQTRAHESGSWPAEVAPGVVPPGMTPEEFKYDDWMRVTPIGGKFDWENNQIHSGSKFRAAIAVTATSDAPLVIDAELFLAIDQAIDDGDLTTGIFRIGNGGSPLFVIEN